LSCNNANVVAPQAETAEWQAAIKSVMLVATSGGPTMFARVGVMGR